MIRRFAVALALLVVAGGSLHAQAYAPPAPRRGAGDAALAVRLGPLGTGRITEGVPVGSVGLFHSDLATVVAGSPEAARYARSFSRNESIGRPLVLIGAATIVAGFWSYVAHGGPAGMGAREAAAVGLGTGIALLGANRLTVSSHALAAALQAYNRNRDR